MVEESWLFGNKNKDIILIPRQGVSPHDIAHLLLNKEDALMASAYTYAIFLTMKLKVVACVANLEYAKKLHLLDSVMEVGELVVSKKDKRDLIGNQMDFFLNHKPFVNSVAKDVKVKKLLSSGKSLSNPLDAFTWANEPFATMGVNEILDLVSPLPAPAPSPQFLSNNQWVGYHGFTVGETN
jgi:hypothetical protein